MPAETPPERTTTRLRYHDLPPDVQGRLLADINQELIELELQNMMTDVGGQTLSNRVNSSFFLFLSILKYYFI